MKIRRYKTASKKILANAYGLQKYETVFHRICRNIHKLNAEELSRLGDFGGPSRLLPEQVELIVKILGTPENPKILYSEEVA